MKISLLGKHPDDVKLLLKLKKGLDECTVRNKSLIAELTKEVEEMELREKELAEQAKFKSHKSKV